MNCPSCALETEGGEVCSACGALLVARPCRACAAELAAGVTCCSRCQAPVRAPSRAGWLIGGALVVAAAAGLLLSSPPKTPEGESPATPAVAVPPRAGPFAAVPPPRPRPAEAAAAEDPRHHADELFNVAMSAAESGDPEGARSAIPEALAAYRALGALDDDGAFHVSLLQLSGGDLPGARVTAEGILAKHPTHLLALSVAARASGKAGDLVAARTYNQKLLAAYETEVVKTLPEYLDHQRVLPIQRDEAKRALATPGASQGG